MDYLCFYLRQILFRFSRCPWQHLLQQKDYSLDKLESLVTLAARTRTLLHSRLAHGYTLQITCDPRCNDIPLQHYKYQERYFYEKDTKNHFLMRNHHIRIPVIRGR